MVPFLYFHTKKTARFSLLGRFASFVVALEKWKGEDTERSSSRTYEKSEDRDIDKPSRGEKEEKRKEKKRCWARLAVLSPRRPIQIKDLCCPCFFFSFSLSGAICDSREREKNVLFRPCLFIFVSLRKRTDCSRRERIGGFCQTADDLKPL